jgi:8-oxo-dGTP pyrophosphatase MutT (NUDIX family)
MTGLKDDTALFSAAEIRARALSRLSMEVPQSAVDPAHIPGRGDHVLNPDLYQDGLAAVATPAAVLVPIVPRANGVNVILTRRSGALRRHAGQVAFPGGRIDPDDDGPVHAALREAEEEIGLDRNVVTPLGFLDVYLTHSGFRILPLVAMVTPPFGLVINPQEVAEAFEVPLQFLMEPANHVQESRVRDGVTRHFYVMPYGENKIWGVTAGIVRNLYERLYG